MKKQVITIHISFVLLSLVACSRAPSVAIETQRSTPTPFFAWDTYPTTTRIVLTTFCCDSPITKELVRPYIPEAQVWSDGHFFWTEQDDDGTRRVFVKQLLKDEMNVLLQEIAASGFFDWDEAYQSEPVVDGVSQCVTVALTNLNKMVCATISGAPDAFYTLFDWLSQGANTNGVLYSPKTAYLTGFVLEATEAPPPAPDLAWPASLARTPVGEAVAGLWLDDGEALQLLWEATNRNPYHMPVVEDEVGRYRIILQVPGVSWLEP